MTARREAEGLKYGLAETAKGMETFDLSRSGVGQRNPQHCPHLECRVLQPCSEETLGQPMDIRQVAALLGCSAWTVRQRYLPMRLPYFRIGSTGKLMFYRNQIVRWILEKQRQKGGAIR